MLLALRDALLEAELEAALEEERPEPEEDDATAPEFPLLVAAIVLAAVADEVTPRETGRKPPP